MYREIINIYDGSIFVDFVDNPHSQIVSNDVWILKFFFFFKNPQNKYVPTI